MIKLLFTSDAVCKKITTYKYIPNFFVDIILKNPKKWVKWRFFYKKTEWEKLGYPHWCQPWFMCMITGMWMDSKFSSTIILQSIQGWLWMS